MRVPWQIWTLIVVTALLIYATKAILLPFVVGLALAYLLDPLADRLEAWKFPRWAAAGAILLMFYVAATGLMIGVLPVLQAQFAGIIENFPTYVMTLRPILEDLLSAVTDAVGGQANVDELIAAAADDGISKLGGIITGFLAQSLALFNVLSIMIITPVVAFFLLRDWDIIVETANQLLPAEEAPLVRTLATRIDAALAGFVRGQTVAVLIMAVIYASGWSVVGLNYALVLGIIAGILAYVPFVGSLLAMVIAMLVGLGQFGMDVWPLAQVFGVYLFVQLIEAAVLTPHVVGRHVGLHPIWVLFAIFAGGEVMGFVGVLLAVPMAAAIGVLVRYAIETYMLSELHRGVKKVEEAAKQ